jgi:hypothetical protein
MVQKIKNCDISFQTKLMKSTNQFMQKFLNI